MTREERELSIEYLEKIKEDYIEGNAYERHPLPEYYAIENAIKALEQEPRWIPVNERLPKKSDNYWCTFGGTNLIGTDYYTTELDAKETFDDAAEEYVGWRSHNVIAWMPLPEPYKAESDEYVNFADDLIPIMNEAESEENK